MRLVDRLHSFRGKVERVITGYPKNPLLLGDLFGQPTVRSEEICLGCGHRKKCVQKGNSFSHGHGVDGDDYCHECSPDVKRCTGFVGAKP
jgi:hypothetical protein